MRTDACVPQDGKHMAGARERTAPPGERDRSEAPPASPLPLGRFDLGAVREAGRAELYAERVGAPIPPDPSRSGSCPDGPS